MKFLLISDIHATSKTPIGRTDNIFETFTNKFIFILQYAQKHNATILQSGDFFDKPRDWYVLFLMTSLLREYKVPIYSIWGQHDLYMRAEPQSTPTTMGILNKLGLIKILGSKPTAFDNINIYGCSWRATIPKPMSNKINILVIHASITTKSLFPGHKFISTPYFISRNKGWNLILAGDIHIKTIHEGGKTIFVNTGPMLRLVSNKYNSSHQPCFIIYDTKSRKSKEIIIPHQESKIILTRKHISKRSKNTEPLPPATLEQFAKLLKQKHHPLSLKAILGRLMRKHNVSQEVKQFLFKIMVDHDD
jgi:DNA repair exonuclease SbcCD nuclease subunit